MLDHFFSVSYFSIVSLFNVPWELNLLHLADVSALLSTNLCSAPPGRRSVVGPGRDQHTLTCSRVMLLSHGSRSWFNRDVLSKGKRLRKKILDMHNDPILVKDVSTRGITYTFTLQKFAELHFPLYF